MKPTNNGKSKKNKGKQFLETGDEWEAKQGKEVKEEVGIKEMLMNTEKWEHRQGKRHGWDGRTSFKDKKLSMKEEKILHQSLGRLSSFLFIFLRIPSMSAWRSILPLQSSEVSCSSHSLCTWLLLCWSQRRRDGQKNDKKGIHVHKRFFFVLLTVTTTPSR